MKVRIFYQRSFVITYYLASSIDQWVDYVNSTIAPLSNVLQSQVFGFEETDQRTFGVTLNSLKKSLQVFEKQLKLRNFLVGYSLTLADVTLLVNLLVPLQTVLD